LFCLSPAAGFAIQYHSGALAQLDDPVQALTHWTGDWALWLLLADLAITPVRRLSPKLAWLVRFRRMLGLYAFFYATLHLSVYVFLFSDYDGAAAMAGWRAGHYAEPLRQLKLTLPSMLDDLATRKFIQLGLLAWTILLALAVTSPQRMLLWLGGKNWARLHRLVYLAAIAAVVHFCWQVKAGVHAPWKYVAILALLLLARLVWSWKKRAKLDAAAVS
jgi:sulfoxide reductase heme-binding subunit YedZ